MNAAAVYGWMMDRMPRFRARQVSGALYAISRLNLYNAELVGALVQVRKKYSSVVTITAQHSTDL
jgi:hypothetical protein